jgi:hypothetical protein
MQFLGQAPSIKLIGAMSLGKKIYFPAVITQPLRTLGVFCRDDVAIMSRWRSAQIFTAQEKSSE